MDSDSYALIQDLGVLDLERSVRRCDDCAGVVTRTIIERRDMKLTCKSPRMVVTLWNLRVLIFSYTKDVDMSLGKGVVYLGFWSENGWAKKM